MKRTLLLLVCAALACAGESVFGQGFRNQTAAQPLTPEAQNALVQALAGPHGEYANLAEYQAILAKFGPDVQPYANLLEAEKRHIAALERQCTKFGVPLPENVNEVVIDPAADLADVAADALEAEQRNVEMYQNLLEQVKEYPSLVQVFSNLQAASRDRHIPALQAAVDNGGQLELGTCPQQGIRRQQRAGVCDQAGAGLRNRGENCPMQGLNCPEPGANDPQAGGNRARQGFGQQQHRRGAIR